MNMVKIHEEENNGAFMSLDFTDLFLFSCHQFLLPMAQLHYYILKSDNPTCIACFKES